MGAIEKLKTEYGIRTYINNGKVLFDGLFVWTDFYRRSWGKDSAWNELQLLMKEAESCITK